MHSQPDHHREGDKDQSGEKEGLNHHGSRGHEAHDKHSGHTPEMFRDRLVVSALLSIPILYFSDQLQSWLSYQAIGFPRSHLVNPILGSLLFWYAGVVFLRGAAREIVERTPAMMTLISVAITVAYTYSLAVSFGLDGEPFYWELATLLDVMLLGHWLEMRSIESAGRALDALADLLPATVLRLLPSGETELIPPESLAIGDLVLIRPGEQVGVDGVVINGTSLINEAFLTGESLPVTKEDGDEVIGGSVNGNGTLTVRTSRLGSDTTLNQISRLVKDAQASRSRFQNITDRAAKWLTLIAIGTSLPTFVAWWLSGESASFGLARAVTVLVIACPHALGLAIPLVNVSATSVAATNGILIRNREAFERGKDLSFVALDKTGTLTEGVLEVRAWNADGISSGEALAIAGALERGSEHPVAEAIVATAAQAGETPLDATNVTTLPGLGVTGIVSGTTYRVGRPEWFMDTVTPTAVADIIKSGTGRGESVVVLGTGDRTFAAFSLSDRVRPTSRAAIERVKAAGAEPVMITGDSEAVAQTVARDLGITTYHARVLPSDKAALVSDLRRRGATAFIGDGVNDAPALAAADLGIAIGAGTNVAIESADVVLVDSDPADVATLLALARATHRKTVQNLVWATGYNVVAIPLAAGVAAAAGVVVSPAIGAVFMSVSTVAVAVNAMTLRWFNR